MNLPPVLTSVLALPDVLVASAIWSAIPLSVRSSFNFIRVNQTQPRKYIDPCLRFGYDSDMQIYVYITRKLELAGEEN